MKKMEEMAAYRGKFLAAKADALSPLWPSKIPNKQPVVPDALETSKPKK